MQTFKLISNRHLYTQSYAMPPHVLLLFCLLPFFIVHTFLSIDGDTLQCPQSSHSLLSMLLFPIMHAFRINVFKFTILVLTMFQAPLDCTLWRSLKDIFGQVFSCLSYAMRRRRVLTIVTSIKLPAILSPEPVRASAKVDSRPLPKMSSKGLMS